MEIKPAAHDHASALIVASSQKETLGLGAALLVIIPMLLLFAIVGTVIYARKRRDRRRAERNFAAKHGENAARLVAETDALIRGLRTQLAPPSALGDWERTKALLAAGPASREAIDQVYAAFSNAQYLAGIERGDGMMRRQAINELVGEARNFGADSVARSAAGLRGREAEPAFVDEYLRCVRALGPHAKRWSDNEFGKLGNLRAMGKRAGGNYPPPGITSREYRPGAGIAGYVPLGAVWEAYAPTMGSYRLAATVGLNAYSEARLYRRWVRGEVAR